MQPDEHIGESAELYAVGALDPAERNAVDAHIAGCMQCRRRVGEAEETVLALERGRGADSAAVERSAPLPFARRRMLWLLPLTAAAAFIVGLLFPRAAPQHDAATLAMIGSHFSHAQFVGSGPPAKVIYARDRSWYYVIVVGNERYGVYGVREGRSVMLGSIEPHGATSELFARTLTPYERIELRGSRRTIEAAAIR